MLQFGRISEPWWDDRPVAIVAGGTSLKGFDFERLRPFHVLAVKGSIFDIPWSAAGFGLDIPRFHEWKSKLATVKFPVYWAVPQDQIDKCGEVGSVVYLKRDPGCGVSDDPTMIFSGSTSGFGSLQIARLKRAKLIGLFGFDYGGTFDVNLKMRTGQPFHHNEEHYRTKRPQFETNWKAWARNYEVYRPMLSSTRVINGSPYSAIDVFPRMTVDEAVAELSKG